MSFAEDDFAVNHYFDLFCKEKTSMNNDAAMSTTNKPNGADGSNSELITTAKNIGASAGAAAATATELAHTAQEYGQKLSGAASQAKEFVSDRVVVVGDKLKELQDVDLSELAESAKDYARRKPGQTILIAAAAGLLLGLVIRGRR